MNRSKGAPPKSGHKPNWAARRRREKFRSRHPEGRKVYALKRKVKKLSKVDIKQAEIVSKKLERLVQRRFGN